MATLEVSSNYEVPGEMEDLHSFKKLSLKRFPKADARDSSEIRFWSRFQFPITVKEYNSITSVNFSPASPHDYVVTSGSRLQVYSSYTNKVKKTLSRFKQMAYSGCFRHDGKLIAAGSEEGVVKVFDASSRAVLRQFKGHIKPAKAVAFSCDGLRLFSGSEDTLVKCWDLSTQSCLATLCGHEDYIRGVAASPVGADILLTASYDHTVRLWDMRRPGSAVLQFCHESPVEGALIFPSGSMCVSCGGQWVRVWELLAGGRSLLALSNHQKTVTALCFDSSCHRLLSASLDKQVKVYSVEDYRVLHSMSYPAPILSIAMAPADTHLVVGMSTKLLSIKHCAVKETPALATPTTMPSKGGSYRYFIRGKTYAPAKDEYVVAAPKKQQLKPYERYLKKFKYRNALLAVLQEKGRDKMLVVYSLLQELARREGLRIALAGLNEDELDPLLRYLSRQLPHPHCAPLLLDVANIITDIYGGMLYESKKTEALFRLLKVKVEREVEFQKQAFQLLGCLDTLLTASITQTVKH